MAPRTEQQFEIIREERKEQIMKVALELIAQDGFANVSISKIAAKAKISKGLMYNYFDSKEKMITEIMIGGFEELERVFDPNKDGILTDDELHFLIEETFRILQSNIKFWRLYFMIMFQPEVYKLIEKQLQKALKPFMNITYNYFVKRGYEDPAAEVSLFGAILDGVSLNFVMNPRIFPLEGIKSKLHSMYK
ncbi:MAG: TetR/AcrR family transcriptional regulator [Bacteroidales bacterium]|nr:TetR/AcrR family transcriptional regulator [Bacteroidales bacterium]MBN2821259.1 TetR/AcrR family transcriptional regulator [Bacteroidales bacterium]